jgi:predicted TIM-barrel fold metal-dependent hydrolase
MQYSCISADDHIDLRFLPKDIFTSRVPAALKDRVPRVVPTNNERYKPEDGMSDWVVEDRVMGPWGCYTAAQASGNAWAIERGGSLEVDVLRPTTAELRLADMDRDGVQASIMYGPPDPFFIDDPEIRRATFRAFNDWVLEFEKAAPERLVAVAQLDYLDPEFSADEFERTAALGIRHVNVLAATAEPSWYEKEWDRFWAIANETKIPVGSHLTVVVQRERRDPSKPNYGGAVFNLGQQLVEPYAGLILRGTFDRYPDVRTVMAESQVSWVPNMIQTLDNGWERGRAGTIPGIFAACEQKPSEYFAKNIWMTFQDDPFGVQMLPMLFEDRVMWASDYPHPASTWPDSQRIIKRQLDGVVEDSTREKLLFKNAQELYGL